MEDNTPQQPNPQHMGYTRHMPPPPPGAPGMPPQAGQPSGYRLSKPRTRIWRSLGLLIFVSVIGFNILMFLVMIGGVGLLAGGGDAQNPHGVMEYHRETGETGKIAVIPVNGVIMEGGGGGLFAPAIDPVAMMNDGLNRAAEDDEVKAVIIEVNSPGGGVTASDFMHHDIVNFREETGKPVVVYMKDLAASGGYYISAPADYIVANKTTLTGSIGVIIQGFNFHGTLTEVVKGQDATIKAGGNKAMGSMFADPESVDYQEGRALLQELVDEMHAHFKQIVRDGRGSKLVESWEQYADGRVMSATQAKKHGFIDEIGYFETAKAKAEELAGIGNASVVEYGRDMSLGALLGLEADQIEPAAKAIGDAAPAIEGQQLRAELQEQLRLYPGRPMAIWVP